jgi:hypothetical protein
MLRPGAKVVINTRGVMPFDRAAPPSARGVSVLLDRHYPLTTQHSTRVAEMHECRRSPLEVKLGLGGEEHVHIVIVGAVHTVVKTAVKSPQERARGRRGWPC